MTFGAKERVFEVDHKKKQRGISFVFPFIKRAFKRTFVHLYNLFKVNKKKKSRIKGIRVNVTRCSEIVKFLESKL